MPVKKRRVMQKIEFKIALSRKGVTQAQMARDLDKLSSTSRWTEAKLSNFVNGLWPEDAKNYIDDAQTICDYLGVGLRTLFPGLKQKKTGNKYVTNAEVFAINNS